jgi:hypothetical protein
LRIRVKRVTVPSLFVKFRSANDTFRERCATWLRSAAWTTLCELTIVAASERRANWIGNAVRVKVFMVVSFED